MRKMILENIKAILVSLTALLALLAGSYSGGLLTARDDVSLGAISGPELTSPFWTVNSVENRYFSSGLNQASTTICSFRTPAATTTLKMGSVQIRTGTTTAIALEMAKSTLLDATTTRIAYQTLASGAQVTLSSFVASSTGATGPNGALYTAEQDTLIFAPSTYLNVKYGSTLGALNVLVGSCKAEFLVN